MALQDQCDTALLAIFKAMYWNVKEDIAVVKWQSLKQLLTDVGVDLSPLYRGRNAKYDSDHIASQVLECLANVVIEQTNKMIEEASFIGVMADGTTDVSNKTQLGIYLRLLQRGMVVSRFDSFQSFPSQLPILLSPL